MVDMADHKVDVMVDDMVDDMVDMVDNMVDNMVDMADHKVDVMVDDMVDMVVNKVDDMVDDMVDVYFQPVSPARTVFYPPPFTCNKTWLECPNGNGGQGGRHDGRHDNISQPYRTEFLLSSPLRFLPIQIRSIL